MMQDGFCFSLSFEISCRNACFFPLLVTTGRRLSHGISFGGNTALSLQEICQISLTKKFSLAPPPTPATARFLRRVPLGMSWDEWLVSQGVELTAGARFVRRMHLLIIFSCCKPLKKKEEQVEEGR